MIDDISKCELCCECINNCPSHCYGILGGELVFFEKNCQLCKVCVDVCVNGALKVDL